MILELSLPAEQDRHKIAHDIARSNPARAVDFIDRIDEVTERLVRSPYLGRVGRIDGTRELVVADSPYVIIYMLSERLVFILRIVHGAQYWPDSRTWQNED